MEQNQTEKFRKIIKESKEEQKQNVEYNINITNLINIIVGILTVTIIYFGYYVLTTKIDSLIKFGYIEFVCLVYGIHLIITYIKNIFKK